MALITRSADLRQARHTSILEDIHIWVDRVNADPTLDLKNLLVEMDLLGARIGVEYDTHGMTGRVARLLDAQLTTFGQIVDASYLVSRLRLSKALRDRLCRARRRLADDALDAAIPLTKPGADEADILAAMQGAIFSGGGDYPANEFIIGSGADALLCRYKAGRRKLDANDQLTLEWAGTYATLSCRDDAHDRHRRADHRHRELYNACRETIQAIETVLKPGHTFGDVFDMHAKIMDERGLPATG
jgi:Xaa-Pro dipeptidase